VPAVLDETLRSWHDFFIMAGTGAATLVGAMFVVASVASGFLTKENASATRVFMTPIVIHLSTVILACVLAMLPVLEWFSFALLLGAGGVAGLVYSSLVGLHVNRRTGDRGDRIWYAVIPILAYTAMIAAAMLAYLRLAASLEALAVALIIVLVAGIRNAWDLILFYITNARRPD